MKNHGLVEPSLVSQVLAILRVWRLNSRFSFFLSRDISRSIDRPSSQVVNVLYGLYEIGSVQRYINGTEIQYRVSESGDRTIGCCCCCNAKLFDATRIFCETCGPFFDGRI